MKFFLASLFYICLIFSTASCSDTSESSNGTITSEEKNNSSTEKTVQKKKKKILFFGDSLAAGYGLEDPSQGFVGAIHRRLDSLGLDYQAVNAGLSGETTSGGNSRVDWVLEQNEIDIFVLELGGNDGLRGIQPDETIKNLQSIIDKVNNKYPEATIILAGMEAPPNMGNDFTSAFRNVFPTLAQKNNIALIPFLLDKVGGIPDLNQPDGIHPNIEGHQILADNVWEVLEPLLKSS